MRIALIGAGGYWAKNVLRNLLDHPSVSKTYLCDSNPISLDKYRKHPYNIDCAFDYKDTPPYYLNCAIVCTPPKTHFNIASYFLQNKIPVLVQKPMAHTLNECVDLNNFAAKNKTLLFVAHTFIYHDITKQIKGYLPELGKIYSFKSVRTNLGLYNRDSSVIEDLFPHDASILLYLFSDSPIWISATGSSHIKDGLIDEANITVGYKNGFQAYVALSWLSAIKTRQITITGEKKTIVWDDCKVDGKLQYHDAGVDYDEQELFSYRKGYSVSPKVSNTEAIYNELSAFFSCVQSKTIPITDGSQGIKVAKMIAAAELSIKLKGQAVPII